MRLPLLIVRVMLFVFLAGGGVATQASPAEGDSLSVSVSLEGELRCLVFGEVVEPVTAYAPGPCWCCQQPFEYREKPAHEPGSPGGRR